MTTSHKPDRQSGDFAREAAQTLGTDFVERDRMSLQQIREKFDTENILVVAGGSIKLFTPWGECFFHPSMSVPRIKALKQGKPDPMVEAMGLKPGDSVLDCTLGLGSDAIVSSFAAGKRGRVTGVESSPELALLVRHGLRNFEYQSNTVREAAAGIEVISGDCADYLQMQPDNSFEIVYFDPMFRFPRKKSSSMEPLRGIVNSDPLDPAVVLEALRVAKRRVVMKENWFSKEFARLGFSRVTGGKYSPVAFGVITKQEAGP